MQIPQVLTTLVTLIHLKLHLIAAESCAVDLDDESDMSAEKALIRRLMHNYQRIGRNGRPVLNISQAVPVTFGLGLINMDLDERNKVLTMSCWTRYVWTDEYLVWDPKEHGGVSQIRLEPNLIWIPDIMLYNTAVSDEVARDALVVVLHDGTISWYPHTIFRSSCSIDVTNFPFDKQFCHMWFGSWTHNSEELNLNMAFGGGVDTSTFQADYKESCAWDITNVTAVQRRVPDEDSDPNFIVLTIDIIIQRKVVFSSYILTLPCVFLACLTLVVFWLPPERPDRTALAMSTFSSFMVLLLILVEAAPPTASSVPTLGVYYCFNMVIIMLSIVLSSLVVNMSRGGLYGNNPVPKWLHVVVVEFLSRIMCLYPRSNDVINTSSSCCFTGSHTSDYTSSTNTTKYTPASTEHSRFCCTSANCDREKQCMLDTKMLHSGCGEALNMSTMNGEEAMRDGGFTSTDFSKLDVQLCAVKTHIKRLESKMDMRFGSPAQKEWRYIAMVMDRFFFVLYLILIIVSLTVLFPRTQL